MHTSISVFCCWFISAKETVFLIVGLLVVTVIVLGLLLYHLQKKGLVRLLSAEDLRNGFENIRHRACSVASLWPSTSRTNINNGVSLISITSLDTNVDDDGAEAENPMHSSDSSGQNDTMELLDPFDVAEVKRNETDIESSSDDNEGRTVGLTPAIQHRSGKGEPHNHHVDVDVHRPHSSRHGETHNYPVPVDVHRPHRSGHGETHNHPVPVYVHRPHSSRHGETHNHPVPVDVHRPHSSRHGEEDRSLVAHITSSPYGLIFSDEKQYLASVHLINTNSDPVCQSILGATAVIPDTFSSSTSLLNNLSTSEGSLANSRQGSNIQGATSDTNAPGNILSVNVNQNVQYSRYRRDDSAAQPKDDISSMSSFESNGSSSERPPNNTEHFILDTNNKVRTVEEMQKFTNDHDDGNSS